MVGAVVGVRGRRAAARLVAALSDRLAAARRRVARRRVAPVATAELWGWEIDRGEAGGERDVPRLRPAGYGSLADHAAEANAAQLWNALWLPVYYLCLGETP